jgi:hypothetical protein
MTRGIKTISFAASDKLAALLTMNCASSVYKKASVPCREGDAHLLVHSVTFVRNGKTWTGSIKVKPRFNNE